MDHHRGGSSIDARALAERVLNAIQHLQLRESTIRTIVLATTLLAFLAVFTFANAADPQPEKGLFATLKPNQQIVMKEVGDKYEISVLETETSLTHVVVEVGPTYVLVRDSGGFIERRIPVYSIKAIITIKTQAQ